MASRPLACAIGIGPSFPRRLTMTEVHNSGLPKSFCHKDLIDAGLANGKDDETLVINTGLWVARYDRPWFQENKVLFRQTHKILKLPRPDGRGDFLQNWFDPEDWLFAIDLKEWDAKVYATTCVKVEHVGNALYPNDQVWGVQHTDDQFIKFTAGLEALNGARSDMAVGPVEPLVGAEAQPAL